MPAPFRGSASGLTRQQLRARRFARLQRDVYVFAPATVTLGVRVDAVLALFPDAVVSHRTAARLLGFPVDDDGLIHLTRPDAAAGCQRPDVRTHRCELLRSDVTTAHGRRITSPQRTFLDLAAVLPHVELVILADAIARRTGVAALEQRLARAHGVRGVRRARLALLLSDPLADSPAETRCRLTLHGAGFTDLRHGVDVSDSAGGWLARPDLADEGAKVAIQYDGLVHLATTLIAAAPTSTATSFSASGAGRSSYSQPSTFAGRIG